MLNEGLMKEDFRFKIEKFSLKDSLYCGQCFRFKEIKENLFLVFSKFNSAYIEQKESELIFYNSSCDEKFWKKYFNFDVDYEKLYSGFKGDLILEKLIKIFRGIRILKQDPFETLISFIFSINNNIARIQKMIEILCENFGNKNKNGYSFPSLNELVKYKKEDFFILKAGFRLNYFMDAILKLSSSLVDLEKLNSLSFKEAKEKLKIIKGVGEKVSSCVLLFAYNNMTAFPVDVWIKKVLEEYYYDGLNSQILTCPGLAQQLLFYGKRKGYI